MRFWRDKNATPKKIFRRNRNILVTESEKNRQEEPKNKNWKVRFIIIGVIGLVLCYWVYLSDYFLVTDVFIEGNSLVPTDLIKEKIPVGKNIFLTNIRDVENKVLKDLTEIKDVRIIRGIPDAYKVVVVERNPKLIWQSNNINYLLSDQGEIIREIPADQYTNLMVVTDKQGMPVINGAKIVSPNFVAFVLNINDQFYNAVNIRPTKYEILDTTFDLYIYTDAGFYVKFNTMRSSARQLENLKIVLAEKRPEITQYIDLRIDGWAYYK